MYRTDYCGSLRREHIGRQAVVCGWVLTRRDMGGVIFVDVRDREGTLQTVFDLSSADAESFATAERLRNQSVVRVTGEVRKRDESTYNAALPTGDRRQFLDLIESRTEVTQCFHVTGSYSYMVLVTDSTGESLCFASDFTVSGSASSTQTYWSVKDAEGTKLQQTVQQMETTVETAAETTVSWFAKLFD